jgi:membrane-bound lytic murein transglycosylase D
MIGTGKGLGLEINSLVDERRDPYRSSAMAAKYLKNLYQIYNDWSLAIAAYNCGPGNVNKALHRNGDKGDFWDIYNDLPRETRGYVPAFIAANYAMTYYKQHNISPSLASKPLITDTVSVNRRIHFAQIAQVLNIPIDEIRTLNPQFRADVIPGDNHPYMLVLPSQQVYSFIMSQDSIDNYRDDLYAHREVVEPGGEVLTADEYISGRTANGDVRTINHKVGRGETLSTIAAKYDMTTSELMAMNNMSSERVRRGDNLKVKAPSHNNASADNEDIVPTPVSQQETSSEDMAMNEQKQFDEVKDIEAQAAAKAPYKGSYTATKTDNNTAATATKATKKSGKSEEQTARQHASRSNTRDWHDRNNKYNKDNDKSRDRKDNAKHSSRRHKSSKKSKPEKPTEVTVQKGESLTKIAEKAGVSIKDIERANGIEDGNKIKAGEKIKIPTKEEARKAAAADNKKGSKSDKKGSKADKKSSKSSKSSSKSSSSGKSGKKHKRK